MLKSKKLKAKAKAFFMRKVAARKTLDGQSQLSSTSFCFGFSFSYRGFTVTE
jgi:hypothetical protein